MLNAVIAGIIVFGIGEGSIYAFEQIYLGNKSLEDVDWVKKILESKLSSDLFGKATKILSDLPENATKKDIIDAIAKLLKK